MLVFDDKYLKIDSTPDHKETAVLYCLDFLKSRNEVKIEFAPTDDTI